MYSIVDIGLCGHCTGKESLPINHSIQLAGLFCVSPVM